MYNEKAELIIKDIKLEKDVNPMHNSSITTLVSMLYNILDNIILII